MIWLLGILRPFRSGELFGLHDTLAFFDRDKLIRLHVFHRVHLAAGPAHFEQFDLLGLAESEVNAQIALRDIAAAAADFVDLLVRLGLVGQAWSRT